MTSELSTEPATLNSPDSTTENNTHVDKPQGVLNLSYSRTDPDVIVRSPVTTQPSLTSLYSNSGELWAYAPSGISPLQRTDFGSLTNVAINSSDSKPRTSISTIPKDSISVAPSANNGNRDWVRDLFEPLKDVRKSKNKCSTLSKLLCQCIRVPCMTCDVAKTLGDPAWLPYVPCTGAALRFKVRILGGIQGTIADDCIVTSCCCPCAVCQMYTEIEDIGLGTS
ncbi:placenta-specific gene 8 protein-like [Plakobranchus ocellatus]|uniref:Placenta-specific gene 8 protein-like n=1 Tax=Plakobranchus ocellatus TaxID=259542 RepID=A0AAV4D2L4_9GAST|nr:placenta-specific gene 8 protein-like [Plakobranchus ocellatus]